MDSQSVDETIDGLPLIVSGNECDKEKEARAGTIADTDKDKDNEKEIEKEKEKDETDEGNNLTELHVDVSIPTTHRDEVEVFNETDAELKNIGLLSTATKDDDPANKASYFTAETGRIRSDSASATASASLSITTVGCSSIDSECTLDNAACPESPSVSASAAAVPALASPQYTCVVDSPMETQQGNTYRDQFEVCLERDSFATSFGIQVAAYSGFLNAKPFCGIYVKGILPDSPAASASQMQVNDRIVAVNSIDISSLPNEIAISLLRQQLREDLCSVIVLERPPTGSVLENLERTSNELMSASAIGDELHLTRSICNNNCDENQQKQKDDENHNDRDPTCTLESDVLTDKKTSEPLSPDGQVHPDVVKALQLTWADILGYDVDIIVAQFTLHSVKAVSIDQALQENNLGFSLSFSNEISSDFRYIISHIEPDALSANLQIGDEILEINGRKIRNSAAREVAEVLYGANEDVRIVAARAVRRQPEATETWTAPDGDEIAQQSQANVRANAKERRDEDAACTPSRQHDVSHKTVVARLAKSKSETNLSMRTWSTTTTNQCSPKRLPSIQKAVRRLQAKSTSPRARRSATHTRRHRKREEKQSTLHKSIAAAAASSQQYTRMMPLDMLMKDYNIQPLIGLAIWTREPVIIDLVKADNAGLGFSVAEYRDPFNPIKPIIVVRSLVPRGVADSDGRLLPGDRLLFVNETQVDSCTLDEALRILRNLPSGVVRLGVAKPLPITHNDALVDMTAPCNNLQDGALQQYASLLANPVTNPVGSSPSKRRTRRREVLKKVAVGDVQRMSSADATLEYAKARREPADQSSVKSPLSMMKSPMLDASMPRCATTDSCASTRLLTTPTARTNGTDETNDTISESRVSNVSISLGGMTSLCSDSDITLSDVCRSTGRKPRKPNGRVKTASAASALPAIDQQQTFNGDRRPWTVAGHVASGELDWKVNSQSACNWAPLSANVQAPIAASESDSIRHRSRSEECNSSTPQSETVVLIDPALPYRDRDRDRNRDADQVMDAAIAPMPRRQSVSTTFTSTETDTADESSAFRAHRTLSPTPRRSEERIAHRGTPTRKLMRAATCDYDDGSLRYDHDYAVGYPPVSGILKQRTHSSEDTLNAKLRNKPNRLRNSKKLKPGTVATAQLYRSDLGLGFSVCKRLPSPSHQYAGCGAPSPNHSGQSTPRPTTMYVKDIAARSPAWTDGTLEPGDQIIKINRVDVSSVGYKEALRLLRGAAGEVELTVLKQPLRVSERMPIYNQPHYSQSPFASSSDHSSASQTRLPPPWYVRGLDYDPKVCTIRDGLRTWLRLRRTAAHNGLGLSIAALTRKSRQEVGLSSLTDTIVITGIQPNSVSALDGRLRLGDRIWQIDECELSGIPAEEAIRILKEKSRGSQDVYLCVERPLNGLLREEVGQSRASEYYEVEINKPLSGGVGILISGSGEGGVMVTGIVPRSIAQADRRIEVGDILVDLNGIDVSRFRQEEVAALLKNAQGLVRFRFKRAAKMEEVSLRSHAGSLASVATSSRAQRDGEVTPNAVANSQSKAMSPAFSCEAVRSGMHKSSTSAVSCASASPSSCLGSKQAYAKRLLALRKRARSASPKRTQQGRSERGKNNKSDDEACETDSTCLWQTILTPLNRIKYSIFPSFTAKSSEDTTNAEDERFVENEYTSSDVFVMRDRGGQLGLGITGGVLDPTSCTPEELAIYGPNKAPTRLPVVTRIVKDGPADRTNQIEVGDQIVLINNQNVEGLTHEQVVHRLRGPPQTPIHFRLERAHERSRLLRLWPNKGKKSQPRRPGVWKVTFERSTAKGLGFCLMGGFDDISGRFVPFVIKAVFPLSPAAKYGLRPGDQLLSINGTPIEGESHESVVNLLKHPKDGKTMLLLLTV